MSGFAGEKYEREKFSLFEREVGQENVDYHYVPLVVEAGGRWTEVAKLF